MSLKSFCRNCLGNTDLLLLMDILIFAAVKRDFHKNFELIIMENIEGVRIKNVQHFQRNNLDIKAQAIK